MESESEERDIEELANELRKLAISKLDKDYSWGKPALDALDCVLSLNRRYKGIVEPRVEAFKEKHPDVVSLQDLQEMMSRVGSATFVREELEYNHSARAETLAGVVNYLIQVEGGFDGANERERLSNWAKQAKPEDYAKVNVKGFGPAGFQYLRMLFGAQTVKPDRHIKKFVSRVIGRGVTDLQAIEYLEQAAKLANLRIREADYGIWEKCADAAD